MTKGREVTILDNLTSGSLKNIERHIINSDTQLVKGDVRDISIIKGELTEVDSVFHLAAITRVPYSVENPTITHQVNAGCARNLLETSARAAVKRFVNA